MSDKPSELVFRKIERATAALRRVLFIGDLFTAARYAKNALSIYAVDFPGMLEEQHPIRDPEIQRRLREFLAKQSLGIGKQAWVPVYVVLMICSIAIVLTTVGMSGAVELGGIDLWIGYGIGGCAILSLFSSALRNRIDERVRTMVREIREDIMKLSAGSVIWADAQKAKP